MTNGNGSPPEGAPPQLNVLAQYTKDLSFENPNAPGSLAPQAQPPQINIQINVGANKVADSDFEVTISIEGKAENAGNLMFRFELVYGGVFRKSGYRFAIRIRANIRNEPAVSSA